MGWIAGTRGLHSTRRSATFVPAHFEAFAARLGEGSESDFAAREAGGECAADGMTVEEALDRLRRTTREMAGRDPSFDEMSAVTGGWSDATLAYLHGLSCRDPLTGLSTQAHLRAVIADLYRVDPAGAPDTHAFVVIQVPASHDPVSHALALATAGRHARSVFAGWEPISVVGDSRVVVLAERGEALARRVAILPLLDPDPYRRAWIEGLPATEEFAGALLAELARS